MNLEPPPTLAKLEPDPGRRWRAAKWAALSAGAAWLWDRPTELVPVLVAICIGGPAFWFGLGPGLAGFRYHGKPAIRIVAWFACLALLLVTMRKIVPFVEAYVAAAV